MRRALAGLYVLQGLPFSHALQRAGYTKASAENSGWLSCTVESCLEEARRLTSKGSVSAILRSSRSLHRRALEAVDSLPDSEIAKPRQLGAVVKLIEISERYHGSKPLDAEAGAARDFVTRSSTMRATIDELRRRGMLRENGSENVDSRASSPLQLEAKDAEILDDSEPAPQDEGPAPPP
jgi:hypothetical protein